MFYTQRRVTDPREGVSWVHGTRIGIAVSGNAGMTWAYLGEAEGLGHADDTLWAPEVLRTPNGYLMFLTVVDGRHPDWSGRAGIEVFESDNLRDWQFRERLELGSERVIDAAVARCADGRWRLWYKNERDDSTTWAAVSDDLRSWTVEGRVIGLPGHEGPNVFQLGQRYWMITDEWRGLGVHASPDGVIWVRQTEGNGVILAHPGSQPSDAAAAHHADVVALDNDRALIYYFTHPVESGTVLAADMAQADRRSWIHVALLTVQDEVLHADRDVPRSIGLDLASQLEEVVRD
ncbi:hypothetical protein [Curtobacterium sp. VKM Ac-1376]|uniref:hypothetical protein n=1 Tax=Curtobacterium sp. VKM Ac-1376 TaxID=123312 RepID=UPI00188A67F8|nr:hypothetical protein [Curtobacterium sp. VKM Ac-1376]MBF4616364.1 hypothetical protein [Curtobacterium sp. VKM Ac-1376]